MRTILISLALLSACSGGAPDDSPGNSAGAAGAPTQPAEVAGSAKGAALSTLTGLYEGGSASQPNQMCVVDRGGEARFGLVVWGDAMHSCSGSGTVTRTGDTLRLKMAGDEACTIEAKISGTTVKMPDSVPEGCSYYCGARARLAGAELIQKGTKREDALKAKDLVGEPLCGEGRG